MAILVVTKVLNHTDFFLREVRKVWGKIKQNVTHQPWSVRVGKTMPSPLSTALGLQPQVISKTSGSVFPHTDHPTGEWYMFIISQLVSGQCFTNPANWLVPGESKQYSPIRPTHSKRYPYLLRVASPSTSLASLQSFINIFCFTSWSAFVSRDFSHEL